jgi:hypothetical protein
MWIKIVSHLRLYMIVTVVSPGETAMKQLLSGEQLHHEVCSTANKSVLFNFRVRE